MMDSDRLPMRKNAEARSPVQARGQRQREKLLRVARETFHRLGYVDTRVADIVSGAGVAHGTFYTYFDSREDVLLAIATVAYEALKTAFEECAAKEEADGPMCRAVRASVLTFEKYADVIFTVEQASAMHPEVKLLESEYRQFVVDRLDRAICQERDVKDASRKEKATAVAIYGAMDALLHAWLLKQEVLDRAAVLAELQRLLESVTETAPKVGRSLKTLRKRGRYAQV